MAIGSENASTILERLLEPDDIQAYYNQEIKQRICLTYDIVNRILAQRFRGSGESSLSSLGSLCPVFGLPHDTFSRIRLQDRKVRLSASIETTCFLATLFLVHQQLVHLETEFPKPFLAVPI